MRKKGIFEFEIEGKKRGFKFGTYCQKIAAEQSGITDLNEMYKQIGIPQIDGYNDKDQPIFKTYPVNISTLLNYFYGAAVHYCHSNGLDVDFNVAQVSDWIDEIGSDKLGEMLAGGLQTYSPKNSESPAQIGENR